MSVGLQGILWEELLYDPCHRLLTTEQSTEFCQQAKRGDCNSERTITTVTRSPSRQPQRGEGQEPGGGRTGRGGGGSEPPHGFAYHISPNLISQNSPSPQYPAPLRLPRPADPHTHAAHWAGGRT